MSIDTDTEHMKRAALDRLSKDLNIVRLAQREIDTVRAWSWLKLIIGFVLGWLIAGIVGST